MRDDYIGLALLLVFGFVFGAFMLWVSNTGQCLNYRKDMYDYIERFKHCSTRIDYIDHSKPDGYVFERQWK